MTVYFIECAGRIKIGYAKDVKERMRALATGAAHDMELLCSLEGSVHYEKAIHRALKPYRQKGEWFDDCRPVRALMAKLEAEGSSALDFVEPPPREKYVPSDAPAFESPLRPVFQRIEACAERYIGTQVSSALKREKVMHLAKGTIANQRIGGHYTSERARVAVVLINDTTSAIEHLIKPIFDSLRFDDDPLDQAVVVIPAVERVERLERGLAALFASPDLTKLDMSGYA